MMLEYHSTASSLEIMHILFRFLSLSRQVHEHLERSDSRYKVEVAIASSAFLLDSENCAREISISGAIVRPQLL